MLVFRQFSNFDFYPSRYKDLLNRIHSKVQFRNEEIKKFFLRKGNDYNFTTFIFLRLLGVKMRPNNNGRIVNVMVVTPVENNGLKYVTNMSRPMFSIAYNIIVLKR